jgi:hypothetical protein
MPGELPFWIDGEVRMIISHIGEAYIRVPNGNVYLVKIDTPGLEFNKIKIGTKISCEVTSLLTRVLSAKIIE